MFSNNWWLITSNSELPKNGVLITSSDDDSLVVKNLETSSVEAINVFEDFPSIFKYRCEILAYLEKRLALSNIENKFIDTSASELIDRVCEVNRLLN